MRVAIDARDVYARERRGTGKNIVDVYRTLAVRRPRWEFVMLADSNAQDDPFADLPNVRARIVDMPGYRFNTWQDLALPALAVASGASVLHCPANTAPVVPLCRLVLTVHDLIPLDTDAASPRTRRWVRRVRRSARLASRIVVPSSYTRERVIEALEVAGDKIRVNYWAPDRRCRRVDSAATLERVRRKFGLACDQSYVLAFGAADPRKNTDAIIRAWGRLDESVRRNAILLVVGLQAGALERATALARASVPDESWRMHGFADEEDLPALMTGATALCYPSRSEGFGLPVVDAFACETPVITSSTTSLPEVAGDAALLVDPESVDAIADALMRVLSSPDLRDSMRAAGRRRLAEFSWEHCADTLADTLEAAAR